MNGSAHHYSGELLYMRRTLFHHPVSPNLHHSIIFHIDHLLSFHVLQLPQYFVA